MRIERDAARRYRWGMQLVINGEAREFEAALSVAELLAALGLAGKPVVVEVDQQAVFPRDHASLQLQHGAQVEIVTLAAGG